MSEKFIAKGDR